MHASVHTHSTHSHSPVNSHSSLTAVKHSIAAKHYSEGSKNSNMAINPDRMTVPEDSFTLKTHPVDNKGPNPSWGKPMEPSHIKIVPNGPHPVDNKGPNPSWGKPIDPSPPIKIVPNGPHPVDNKGPNPSWGKPITVNPSTVNPSTKFCVQHGSVIQQHAR